MDSGLHPDEREFILQAMRAMERRLLEDSARTREAVTKVEERIAPLEKRVGDIQGQLVELAQRDTETTSRVGDVQVELVKLTARAGQHADRSEEASRRAEDAVARAGRGRARRAVLQAAGVVAGAALVTMAQRCTPAHGHATERPQQQEQAGP